MSWRGTVRAYQSAVRQAERSARKKQRELELQQKQYNKMQELERAKYEVLLYENKIELIQSLHKDCGPTWDWVSINNSIPPNEPVRSNENELKAKSAAKNYKPGAMDKLLNKAQSKIEQLKKTIHDAIKVDENNYKKALKEYDLELEEWKRLQNLSSRILNKESKYYIEAIKIIDPFSEIQDLGAKLNINIVEDLLEITFCPNDEKVIPSETKSLLASGKLSMKATPKIKLNLLYQDYLCSAVLRIVREIFAILPIDMVRITAEKKLLNTQTGYMEEKPVLAVAISKDTLDLLNLDLIDPSHCMINFVHNMKFNKANGFSEVERIQLK